MAMIAPSILSADFANLERDIHDLEVNGADMVHVDIMDGIFVPNISIGIPVVKALRPVTDLPLDVHLMIDRPIRYIEEFVKAGADWLTIHIEADTEENTHAALAKIRELEQVAQTLDQEAQYCAGEISYPEAPAFARNAAPDAVREQAAGDARRYRKLRRPKPCLLILGL